jgi:hypothetical protein
MNRRMNFNHGPQISSPAVLRRNLAARPARPSLSTQPDTKLANGLLNSTLALMPQGTSSLDLLSSVKMKEKNPHTLLQFPQNPRKRPTTTTTHPHTNNSTPFENKKDKIGARIENYVFRRHQLGFSSSKLVRQGSTAASTLLLCPHCAGGNGWGGPG